MTPRVGLLKLRHLQLMAEIGAAGSLGLAARAIGITQPAASRLLAEIETIIGVAVFDRQARGIIPNVYGEVLIRRAQAVVAEIGTATQELDALRAGTSGSVAFGTVASPAVDIVARVLTDLQDQYAGLRISVEVAPSLPLVAMLLEGKLDFIIARVPATVDAHALAYREIGPEDLSFLARDDHPLHARTTLDLAELVARPWIMQPPGTLLRRRVDLLFQHAGLGPPPRVLNTASTLLTVAVLGRGGVIGALTASMANLFTQGGRLRQLPPIANIGRVAVEPFGLVRRRDRSLSPAASRVYTMIAEALI